jgi:phosphoribosyl 1,2-cyclic phosphodiesterase
MKNVTFWGTRGSLPIALTASGVHDKIRAALSAANGRSFAGDAEIDAFIATLPFHVAGTFGGHSSCVEIVTDSPCHFICDLGSGARPLGQAKIMQFGPAKPQTYHVFISHLHWDHMMGFPFFVPMYIPGNHIIFHGCHERLEQAVRLQMSAPCFPVDYSLAGARIEYDIMTPGQVYEIEGMRITPKLQLHAGDSYGYRFEEGGHVVVYSTDSEHKLENIDEFDAFADFFSHADLVVFDAMYSLADAISVKADWGHSSNMVGVELCHAARARRLALFHHEPVNDDRKLCELLAETRRLEEIARPHDVPLEIISAYDGLKVVF